MKSQRTNYICKIWRFYLICMTKIQFRIINLGEKKRNSIWEQRIDITKRKVKTIFKSRDITLPTKVRLVKAMVFPVVMYGCESWTVKKAECRRIDAFELWCWRRLLRVPWRARRSNQSILKEISPGISLEGMMLKLKLQYFGHLMRRVDSLENTLMLGGIGGRRRRGRQRMRWLDGIDDSKGRGSGWTPGVGDGQGGWRAVIHGVAKSRTRLSNWTEPWRCWGWHLKERTWKLPSPSPYLPSASRCSWLYPLLKQAVI